MILCKIFFSFSFFINSLIGEKLSSLGSFFIFLKNVLKQTFLIPYSKLSEKIRKTVIKEIKR